MQTDTILREKSKRRRGQRKKKLVGKADPQQLTLEEFARLVYRACGSPLTGYKRSKGKNVWYYYKDRGKGHKMNAVSTLIHEEFSALLSRYSLHAALEEKFREALESVFYQMESRGAEFKRALQIRLSLIEKKDCNGDKALRSR